VLQGEISQVKKGGARISSNCAVLLAGSVQSLITSNQPTYTLSALSRAQPPLLSSMLLSTGPRAINRASHY